MALVILTVPQSYIFLPPAFIWVIFFSPCEANQLSPGCFCNLQYISHVVPMPVTDQDIIRLQFRDINMGSQLVRPDEWIEKQGLPSDLHGKTRVAIISNLH